MWFLSQPTISSLHRKIMQPLLNYKILQLWSGRKNNETDTLTNDSCYQKPDIKLWVDISMSFYIDSLESSSENRKEDNIKN